MTDNNDNEEDEILISGEFTIYSKDNPVQDFKNFIQRSCVDVETGEIVLVGGTGPGGNSPKCCIFEDEKGIKLLPSLSLPNVRDYLFPLMTIRKGKKELYCFGGSYAKADHVLMRYSFFDKEWKSFLFEDSWDSSSRFGSGGFVSWNDSDYLCVFLHIRSDVVHDSDYITPKRRFFIFNLSKEQHSCHSTSLPSQKEHELVERKLIILSSCILNHYVYALIGEKEIKDIHRRKSIVKNSTVSLFRFDIFSRSEWEEIAKFPFSTNLFLEYSTYGISDQSSNRLLFMFPFKSLGIKKKSLYESCLCSFSTVSKAWRKAKIEVIQTLNFQENPPVLKDKKIWMIGGYNFRGPHDVSIIVDTQSFLNLDQYVVDLDMEERKEYFHDLVLKDDLCEVVCIKFWDGREIKFSAILLFQTDYV